MKSNLLLISLLSTLVTAVSCGSQSSKNRHTAAADAAGEADQNGGKLPADTSSIDDTKKDKPEDSASLTMPAAAIGIRNFEQIVQSYAKLTGVSSKNATIVTALADLKASLPDNNDLRTLTPAKVSGLTKLAATFCDVAMADVTLRAKLFPTVNFAAGPATSLVNTQPIVTAFLTLVWGADVMQAPMAAADAATLNDLLTAMKAGKANTAAMTANLLMGTCAAALASSPVITL